nr:immunoglobulin light chain junction region [Macaca mulatta]MOV76934.1 immunoglobulin light chain junction region [Macaca mulatta]
CMQGIQLPLIF